MIKIYAAQAPGTVFKGIIRDLRAVWLMEELGEPYELIFLKSRAEFSADWYLKLNPFGKVPTIQDGEFCLFESAAILNYLADKHGKFIPRANTQERAIYDQWMMVSVANIESQAIRTFGYEQMLNTIPESKFIAKNALDSVQSALKVLDKELSLRRFLCPDIFTAADIMMGSVLRYLYCQSYLSQYSNTTKYLDRLYSRPAYVKAFELNGMG